MLWEPQLSLAHQHLPCSFYIVCNMVWLVLGNTSLCKQHARCRTSCQRTFLQFHLIRTEYSRGRDGKCCNRRTKLGSSGVACSRLRIVCSVAGILCIDKRPSSTFQSCLRWLRKLCIHSPRWRSRTGSKAHPWQNHFEFHIQFVRLQFHP